MNFLQLHCKYKLDINTTHQAQFFRCQSQVIYNELPLTEVQAKTAKKPMKAVQFVGINSSNKNWKI